MNDWDEIFGADGPLARTVPGFTTRPEQIAMAHEVARTLHTHGRLVVEAGTGTGKTFAYLVPVLMSGKRVIVSTGTRTLQDQLYHRDLPTVTGALGRPVRVALLKGRANYLCLHRLELAEQQAVSRGLRREVAMALPHVRDWSHVTRQGDIAELARFSESEPVWPWVTSTRDNCLGPECPVFDRCHVMKARREAQAATIRVERQRVGISWEPTKMVPACDIPHIEYATKAARREIAAVGAEGHNSYRVVVISTNLAEGPSGERIPSQGIPHAYSPGPVPGRKVLAVRTERDTARPDLVVRKFTFEFAGG